MTAPIRHAFRHKALFYGGAGDFVRATLPFVRGGVHAGEPVLVAVEQSKIGMLREALGEDAGGVSFVEMRGLGRNPGCIIPAWREFVAEHAVGGRRVRGVGEPVWAGRSEDEIHECHQHEALLNVAFDDGPAWTLVCPYDTQALAPEVIEAARRTHPIVGEGGVTRRSADYRNPRLDPLGGELEPVPARREELGFARDDLPRVRAMAKAWAQAAGASPARAADLVLAISELATNSIRHGGGGGLLRSWRQPDRLVCEVRDSGLIADPLAGRGLPAGPNGCGRGLWLVNRLCDLVQIRSLRDGTAVRVHLEL